MAISSKVVKKITDQVLKLLSKIKVIVATQRINGTFHSTHLKLVYQIVMLSCTFRVVILQVFNWQYLTEIKLVLECTSGMLCHVYIYIYISACLHHVLCCFFQSSFQFFSRRLQHFQVQALLQPFLY